MHIVGDTAEDSRGSARKKGSQRNADHGKYYADSRPDELGPGPVFAVFIGVSREPPHTVHNYAQYGYLCYQLHEEITHMLRTLPSEGAPGAEGALLWYASPVGAV